MGDAWSDKAVYDGIRTIIGKGKGSGPMPSESVGLCHGNLGAVVKGKLDLGPVSGQALDGLIIAILRAALDAHGHNPTTKALRALLGFCTDEDLAVELKKAPHHSLPARMTERGCQSKQMRLWLAGQYQPGQIGIRAAWNMQETWTKAMVGILHNFLHINLAKAKKVAIRLGLQPSLDGETTTDQPQQDEVYASPTGRASTTPTLLPPTSDSLIAPFLVLSEEVERALKAARSACQVHERFFNTSDTLLALLNMPNGHVRACFDDASRGLADQVRQRLAAVPDLDKAKHKFDHFKWIERPEVGLALQYALDDGAPVVNEFHLLLAILEGTSETSESLKRYLKQNHAQVRAAAERGRRDGPEKPRTPSWGTQ